MRTMNWIWKVVKITRSIQTLTFEDTRGIRFGCVTYHAGRQVLAGGTDSGHVMLWKMVSNTDSKGNLQRAWKVLTITIRFDI